MESLYLLIPLAILVAFIIAALFFWSVKSGQFDDMQGPAHSILMDDDSPDLVDSHDNVSDTLEEKEDSHGKL
ncbi:MAG: cbb3-type cytochrome oxidase assembly protein CcoS [Proteobacteria bacterium]|nr:cbb3-type cytochrome oxidase assembly protein CcoS [Pseudomonadota bacterium]